MTDKDTSTCTGEQATPQLMASSLVLRLQWESARFASLVTAPLLRDHFISKPIPPPPTVIYFHLFDRHVVALDVTQVLPSSPSPLHPSVGTPSTDVFILPPLPPSLSPPALATIPSTAFIEGADFIPTVMHALSTPPPPPHGTTHSQLDLPSPRILLLHSPHGYGKTASVAVATHCANALLIRLSPSILLPHATSPSALLSMLLYYAHAAAACAAPVMLLLDDAQFIFPASVDHRFAAVFPPFVDAVRALQETSGAERRVVVTVVATPDATAVHPAVVAAVDAVFACRVAPIGSFAIDVAERHGQMPREELARRLLGRPPHPSMAHLVAWARSQHPLLDDNDDMNVYTDEKDDKGDSGEGVVRLGDWTAVEGKMPGVGDIVHVLRRALEWPLRRRDAMKRLGVRPIRGVLLYGVPGTGKTAVIRHAAEAAGYKLECVNAAEIAVGEVGAAERRLRNVMQRAAEQSPVIVFFDEVDALMGYNGHGASSSSHGMRLTRVFGRLLETLKDGVVVMAATNRPWTIARGLIRPGRFDHCVKMGLPDGGQRGKIVAVYAGKMGVSEPLRKAMVTGIGGRGMDGVTGADIEGACRMMAMMAVGRGGVVEVADIERAFRQLKRSVSLKEVQRIDLWRA